MNETPQNCMTTVSTNLQRWREKSALTQEEVARATGLHVTAISHWERGLREPTIRNLKKLCSALGCTANDVIYSVKRHDIPAGRIEELWRSGAAFVKR